MMVKWLIIGLFLIGIGLVSASNINDSFHINLQLKDGDNIQTGTFSIQFNITTDTSCTNVLYTNTSTLTTDSSGIISYYLENLNLNFTEQYSLCIYKNGSLSSSFQMAYVPYSFYAKNVSSGGIINDSNIDLTNYNLTSSWVIAKINASNVQNDVWIEDSQEGDLNTNSSDYWDGVNTFNSSELEQQSDGNLGILDSFINLLIDNRVTQAFIKALGFYDDTEVYNKTETYNKSEVFNQSEIIAFGYYNGSDFVITDYLTKNEILAFGYYNSTDFVITDYFTKSDINGFNFYNATDFDIADYFTKSQVLAFNYYNSTDFDINDYVTEATVLGWDYYNSTDFDINNYYTKSQIDGFNYYNATNFDINDYFTKTEVLSFNYYNSTDFNINDYITFATLLGYNYYNSTDFVITDYYTKSDIDSFNYYNLTDFDINDYLTATQINATIGIYNDTMKAYVDAQDTAFNDSIKAIIDSNYSANDGAYRNTTNNSYYLNTNPNSYYNSTNPPPSSGITAVNATAGTHNGALTNGSYVGYRAGNEICSIEFSGSHLCTEFEVSTGFANGVNALDNEDTWIIAGGPKYVPATIPVDDCKGFTYSGTSTNLGNYYHHNTTSGGEPRAINCGSTLKLACCTIG